MVTKLRSLLPTLRTSGEMGTHENHKLPKEGRHSPCKEETTEGKLRKKGSENSEQDQNEYKEKKGLTPVGGGGGMQDLCSGNQKKRVPP